MARGIDHLVLPVASLDVARARYQALGFHVNADGVHPFGTKNSCIFFANGTYLEPLAVHDKKIIDQHRSSNSFVALNQRFREKCGDEGFSAVALQTDDASADEKVFQEAGLAGESMLSFSRKAVHADGSEDILKVDGAFCIRKDLDSLAFFTCAWLGNPETIKRIKTPGKHPNGVIGVSGIVLLSTTPENELSYLHSAFGAPFEDDGKNTHKLQVPNAEISLLTPDDFYELTGERPEVSSMVAGAFHLLSSDLKHASEVLRASEIVFRVRDGALIIPPAPGQGATIIMHQKDH